MNNQQKLLRLEIYAVTSIYYYSFPIEHNYRHVKLNYLPGMLSWIIFSSLSFKNWHAYALLQSQTRTENLLIVGTY